MLVEHLKLRDDSVYASRLAGGEQMHGWGTDRHLLANVADILEAIAAGLGGNKNPQFTKRPKAVTAEPEQAATVAEFDVDAFLRRLAS